MSVDINYLFHIIHVKENKDKRENIIHELSVKKVFVAERNGLGL